MYKYPEFRMDQYPGFFEAERGLFEMYESMDQSVDYFIGGKCKEELESDTSEIFTDSEVNSETPHFNTNIYEQHALEVFGGHAGSILSRRSLHKKTVRSCRTSSIVTNSSSSDFSGGGQIWNTSIRNHPSAPPAKYRMKQHYSRRMLHNYYPHQSYQTMHSNLSAHATEHPAAPPVRYQLKQHHSRRILHKYYPHQSCQDVNSNLQAHATEQSHCIVDSVRHKSKYSSQQKSKAMTKVVNTSKKGVSLRNFPNAPAPYITQIKHNEQTSRYISQLNKKVTELSKKKKCSSFEKCEEASLLQSFQKGGNSYQDLIEISSEDSFEDAPMNIKNTDSDIFTSLNSDSSESENLFVNCFPNPGKRYGSFTTRRTSFKGKEFIPGLASVTSDGTAEKQKRNDCQAAESDKDLESTITSSSTSPQTSYEELPRSLGRPDTDAISSLKLAKETCIEPESSCRSLSDESQDNLLESTSCHGTSQNDHPELPRCLSTPELHNMDFISPFKITDETHDELEVSPLSNKSSLGVKWDVSFSFMDKGGYHPIALPLGCHILEDGSEDSELDEEGTSVLEKRMNKMGRDEYNLNVDTSSTFMPWIVIPLDEVPRVNYAGVKFQSSDDPRCKKKEKSIELDFVGHEGGPLFTSDETEIPSVAFSSECQNDSTVCKLNDRDIGNKDASSSVDFLAGENTNVCSKKTAYHVEDLNIFDLSFPDLFLQRNEDALEFPDIFLDSLSQDKVNSEPRKEPPQFVNSSMAISTKEHRNESHMDMKNSLKFSDKTLNSASQENMISESEKDIPLSLNSKTFISSPEVIPYPQQIETSFNYGKSSLEFHDTILDSLVQEKETSEPGRQFPQQNNSSKELATDIDQRNTTFMIVENLSHAMTIPNVCESENNTSNHTDISATLLKSASSDVASGTQNVFSEFEQQQPCTTEDFTVDSKESSSPANAKKLPNSTVQLLKESSAFLKDDTFSTRRVRRLRRVATSLRVQDYALPNSLEEFYVESESCNYAERSGISLSEKSHGKEMPHPCSTHDDTNEEETRHKDNSEIVRMVTRSSTRATNKNRSIQAPIAVSKPRKHNYLKSTEKRNSRKENDKDNTQQSFQEEQTAECEKENNHQENSKRKPSDVKKGLFLVKFEGRKYKCSKGILTPVGCKDSVSNEKEKDDSDLSLNEDFDQNASKTGHKIRMRNGVVKKRKKNERGNSSQERSGVKKSRSQSPKVMIQNCLQEIAVSITKNSKTVTTRKSKKVCIVQKTTRVKKELFPVNRKKSGKTVKDISHSSALKLQKKGTKASPAKKGVSEKKKHGIVKQNQSSTRSDQNKTTKNKKTSTDEKVLKSQKGASPLEKEDKVANKTQPRKLPVKPVIRIHQGLRNTSLKTFKAQQNGKKVKELTKNIPQKPFPCAFCQKRFKKASQIEKHIKDDHKCSRCDKVLDSKEAKQRHFYGFHATEVHKCVTCQKEYNYPFHLRKHFESRSHKDLIKCLIKEMKKLSRGTSSIRGKALKDGNSKPAICPSETSNHDLTAYDKTSQSRSRKKVKFMEMENTFFDENADLLELIHKIEYTSGESGIVRHFLYKDPELAEIQSCLKEESNSSTCYEEIEIVKEYSITSHCENFLEDAGHPLAISDSSRSSERRDSETSISSESSELSEMNHGWNDSYVSNNVTMEPVMYGKARLESNSNSAMSGWFSAAFDVIEQRNLDDDPTYSSYLGLLSNESGMQICSVSSTVDPLNRSTQEYTKTYQELSCISSAKDLGFMEKGPIGIFSSHEMENGNHLQNNHFRAGDFSLTNSNSYTWSKQDRSCLQPPGAVRQELLSNGNSLCPLSPSVYGGHQTMSWIHPRQTANDTLDAAQSLIMLSNPEQGISPEVDNRSTDNESTNKDVQMEWESICSEIQRDVQEYTE